MCKSTSLKGLCCLLALGCGKESLSEGNIRSGKQCSPTEEEAYVVSAPAPGAYVQFQEIENLGTVRGSQSLEYHVWTIHSFGRDCVLFCFHPCFGLGSC